ncbi:MAG: FCSD flavin-binding domain-containing protein [Pseudomonadota bacterium]
MNRRELIKALGAAGALTLLGQPAFAASKKKSAHIVIIGGGIGGATAAKYLRLAAPSVKITLVEPVKRFITCLRSNDVAVGHMTLDDITFTYDALRSKYKVNVVHDRAIGFDPDKKTVQLDQGGKLGYDKLVVSPGIDFIFGDVEGYHREASQTTMPHAWKAGPQTLLLKKQLEAMPQGGTFLMVAPPNPFRCPPGPYERASLVAEWMQKHNPKAKVIILDHKDAFTKDVPFKKAWERLYGYNTPNSMIEWIPAAQGGTPVRVDAANRTVVAKAGTFKADVVNYIAPQRAGTLAFRMGLTNRDGWCPVNRRTFESEIVRDVHVIGDACVGDSMPKSGYSANSQAKVAVQAIADMLAGKTPGEPSMINVCYSLAGEDYGVSIADIFKVVDNRIIKLPASGVSPITDSPAQPLLEAVYQRNWHRTFANDCFA